MKVRKEAISKALSLILSSDREEEIELFISHVMGGQNELSFIHCSRKGVK